MAHHMGMIQQRQTRARRSGDRPRTDSGAGTVAARAGEWGLRLGWAILAIALISAVANAASLVAVMSAMSQAGPPQGPASYLPVVAGAIVGLLGDLLMLSGAAGVLRPGARMTSGRSSVVVGLVLELVAAVAVGTLEASSIITTVYLVFFVTLGVLWVRLSPVPGERPLAQHPAEELTQRRRTNITPTGRWTVQGAPRSMPWSGTVPLPPSAPAVPASSESTERERPTGSAWTRP